MHLNVHFIYRQRSDILTPAPKGNDLDAIFVIKDYRKILADHTFSYGNKFYRIKSPLRHSIAKQKIEIRTTHKSSFTAYFAGRKLEVSEVIEPTKPSMLDLNFQKKLEVLELAEQLGNPEQSHRYQRQRCLTGLAAREHAIHSPANAETIRNAEKDIMASEES